MYYKYYVNKKSGNLRLQRLAKIYIVMFKYKRLERVSILKYIRSISSLVRFLYRLLILCTYLFIKKSYILHCVKKIVKDNVSIVSDISLINC